MHSSCARRAACKRAKPTTSEDRVGASLPPRIEGATRGELDVRVSELRGAEGLTLVLRWWGEGDQSGGVAFDVTRKNQKRGKAQFGISSNLPSSRNCACLTGRGSLIG